MDHNIVKRYHVTVGFLEVLQRMCFSSHAFASTSLNKPFQSVQNINSMNDNLIVCLFVLMPLFQDVSANSSPLFSSAENSFDKNKLVVSNSFLHFKTIIVSFCFFLPLCFFVLMVFVLCSSYWQNSSQSSLDDSFDQFNGSKFQTLQEDRPLHRLHTGENSAPPLSIELSFVFVCFF